ncbi:SDR family NAD(P)-dependent oxidoreductase [Streptomyces griseoaurantiacus]|uniref:SDR family NAD(P)-dependent oxidoreductase n=1 Tax=Streptomyces griseoaurantiacus TaxID=68213 RepID=UPI00386DCBAC
MNSCGSRPGFCSPSARDQGFLGPGVDPTGQVALVTGGSAGLGRAIALGPAFAGSTVVVSGRRLEACRHTAAETVARTGGTAAGMSCDVTEDASVHGLVRDIVSRYGRLDALVSSAGIQARGALDALDTTTLRRCRTSMSSEPSSRARPLCRRCAGPGRCAVLSEPAHRHGWARCRCRLTAPAGHRPPATGRREALPGGPLPGARCRPRRAEPTAVAGVRPTRLIT